MTTERLSVAYLPLTALAPAARNPRTHSPAQVEQIARSITAFGWTNPVLIDEAHAIIAGHGRLEAARKLGMADVPTITLSGLSDAQKRALVIADNQLALNAGWNDELLALELAELDAGGLDLSLVGFSDQELQQLLAEGVDPAGEWQGMPEFEQPDAMAFRTLKIHFKDQAAVDQFARLIGQPITENTRFAWFPQVEHATFRDKQYDTIAA